MIEKSKELAVMERWRGGDQVLFIPSGHQCDILSVALGREQIHHRRVRYALMQSKEFEKSERDSFLALTRESKHMLHPSALYRGRCYSYRIEHGKIGWTQSEHDLGRLQRRAMHSRRQAIDL